MKASTIHVNPMGELVNPSSAVGFRLEDDDGSWIEVRVVKGRLKMYGNVGEVWITPKEDQSNEQLDEI